jgi:hypothetical protein
MFKESLIRRNREAIRSWVRTVGRDYFDGLAVLASAAILASKAAKR